MHLCGFETESAGAGLLNVEEDRGGWGEWVPLIPDTPQPSSAATEAEQVSQACQLDFPAC